MIATPEQLARHERRMSRRVVRGFAVFMFLVGALVIDVAVTAKLDETGGPFPPGWIAGVSILGFCIAVGGVVVFALADEIVQDLS